MSAKRKQSNSDPLPYVQVDRAVKPKVALLAGAMGVSTQHALGSVVEFWDLCGDPRELERVVESTPEGVEPEVVLPKADVELRFKLASGRDVPAETLAAVGLVETRGDRARVRGMSRYFEPVLKRISARKAASAGGKASAEARRKAYGTAQPRSGAGSEVGSESASSAAQATAEATPKRPRSDVRSDAEAESNPSGQRSAVSGQLQSKDSANLFDSPPVEPPKRKADKPPDPRHAPLVARLVDAFKADREAPYPFGPRDAKVVSNLLARAEPDAIVAAWERALRHQGYPTVATLAQLEQHLAQFVAVPRATIAGPPKSTWDETGPVRAQVFADFEVAS